MTHPEANLKINKTALYRIKETELACTVKIQAARHEYGRARFQIAPINGSGSQWVDETSLIFPLNGEKGK